MSPKIDILSEERIILEAIFDLKELYKHAHDWLEWRDYAVAEKKYKEKVKQTGKDIEVEWEASREIDEYTQFVMKITWKVFGLTDVEVQREGGKVKMNKGEVNVFITARLVTDWQNKWEETKYLKFLQAFFEKYLYKGTLDRLKGQLWKEGWDFVNEIKAFLHLYRYT